MTVFFNFCFKAASYIAVYVAIVVVVLVAAIIIANYIYATSYICRKKGACTAVVVVCKGFAKVGSYKVPSHVLLQDS